MDVREEKLLRFGRERIGPDIKTSTVVQLGKPYEEIISLAKARRVDLIILATHGYTGVERLFLGSTTEKVIRHAPCPVLVVREKERDFLLRDEASIRSKL
jgi:nucleotide-binding universal stress UspA family protein